MRPWNLHAIDTSRGPAGNYRDLRKPLISPPQGLEWQYDESNTEKWVLKRTSVRTHNGSDKDSSKNKNTREVPLALIEGVDYLKHTILHGVDTFQGLCLKYKISAVQLRQANGGFSGTNLRLAPPVLYIPLRGHPERLNIRAQDTTTLEYKMQTLVSEFPRLRYPEAKAYLALADGDLEAARKEAEGDLAWEDRQRQQKQQQQEASKTSGVTVIQKKQIKQQRLIHAHVGVPVTKAKDIGHSELELRPLLQ